MLGMEWNQALVQSLWVSEWGSLFWGQHTPLWWSLHQGLSQLNCSKCSIPSVVGYLTLSRVWPAPGLPHMQTGFDRQDLFPRGKECGCGRLIICCCPSWPWESWQGHSRPSLILTCEWTHGDGVCAKCLVPATGVFLCTHPGPQNSATWSQREQGAKLVFCDREKINEKSLT